MLPADQVVLKQARQKARPGPQQWTMSVAIAVGLASALGGLGAAFTDGSYWFVAVGVASLVTISLVATRAFSRWRWLVPLVGMAVALICLTFSFAPARALLRFIPTFEVFGTFAALVEGGITSISEQSMPAKPVTGIVFLIAVGAAVLAIALDFTAFVAKRPALVGIPLLGILLVPTFFKTEQSDPLFFFLTAISYLLVLYVGLGEVRTGGALGVGAVAVAIALIAPLVLPPVAEPEIESRGPGFAVGLNAFISLGDDLRRNADTRVITYTTDADRGVYLSVYVIDEFEGDRWTPDEARTVTGASLDAIGPVPGMQLANLEVAESTTEITIVNMGGHWLPSPYAPRVVTGADANWSFEPTSLTLTSSTESARGEQYTVSSALAVPTVSQLRATGTTVQGDLSRFLRVPDDLPAVVEQTARDVVGNADNHFDMAMALQRYFTDGEFEYSETAPVERGYDGSSATIIGEFLEQKAGYCVHFASAMAVMARTLGIPSRIAVGFTPGTYIEGEGDEEGYFAVSTENFHAWPELWFDNVGWVRFEPTVSVGELPDFSQISTPQTPQGTTPTTSTTPSATPTPTSTTSATPSATPGALGSSSVDLTIPRVTIGILIAAAVIVLLLPLLPMLLRTWRRARRYWRVRRHSSATAAWEELNDTAVDLGWNAATTTPRQFATLVRRGMPAEAVDALGRLLVSIEATAYSRSVGSPVLADLTRVRRAMWKVSTREERLRAAFTPASAALRRRSGALL